MKNTLLCLALFSVGAATASRAAEETPAPPAVTPAVEADAPDSKMKSALTAQLMQDAKNITAEPSAVPAPPALAKTEAAAAVSQPRSQDTASKPAEETAASEPNETTPSLMPGVEVRRSRITDLDIQLREQEKEIAREQALTKPTETDRALNGEGISKALSILGGRSADERAISASERVSLMEDERDIIEQMKLTKDPKRKAELKKQLEDMRMIRRELEKPTQ